jgi:two-component system, cell cycle sensor histidine kinase and response regulator CckA
MDPVERTGSTRASRPWRREVAAAGAVVLFCGVLSRAPLTREASQLTTDLVQLAACLVAAFACGRAASRARGLERWFWALTSCGVSIWAGAQFFWTIGSQGLAPADLLAPSDFLFLASSAPLLLALVVRPDEPREGALGFVFDAGLVAVFALHAYLYFSLGYLIGERQRYDQWVNALGNLDSIVVLLGFLWVYRDASGAWRRTYRDLGVIMVALHGGSTLSSYSLVVGEYHPGFLDLPWILPFVWLAMLAFSWRPEPAMTFTAPTGDFRETRRGLVLAILVSVAVPALHLVTELVSSPNPALSRARHLLTLATAIVLGALFLARQLALLRRTEGLHLAREKNLRRLFDSNPLPQFLCLKNGLHILEVNRAAELVYGFGREEFLGMSFSELHPSREPDELERCIESAARPEEDGRIEGDWEYRGSNGTGGPRVMELTARALELAPRETFLVVAADVTEHRDLEERMLHSQKMEALGRLAGGIAHDFNNLLTAILGYCSLLGPRVRDATAQSFVREVARSGERAAALTKQLLAFSRKQVLVPQVLDLGEVIRGLDLMLAPVLGEDVKLVLDIAEDDLRVKAERGQIEQVILNLVVNARDAMPQGGVLELALFPSRGDSGSENVVLAVSDTGTGMDEATRSRVFEPFFTTKAPGKGTGLGLATVYGIVTQSGGAISIESRVGRGSRVVLTLPRCWESCAVESALVEKRALTGTATILLVEDEDVVRDMTGRILAEQGYRVLTASCGADAIELARDHREIDLVVTDVVMPGMKGPELVERLLGGRPSLKVLYVSGYAADALGLGGARDTDRPFLAKPFTAADLARRVRDVLDPVPASR